MSHEIAALSAREVVSAVTLGTLSEEAVREYYVRRARNRQADVRAWAHIGPKSNPGAPAPHAAMAPLRGVPIAIKDLSDTFDMPTSYGSSLYAGNRPAGDAACVAIARAAGAAIIGKAATVEFGATRPCATRNPLNLAHTPGGSSAGSAAAVADGQALLATGSQTGGSIIRPAAFCGVVGFKPSFGALSTAGTRGYCWSLDTVGVFARNVADAALFYGVLRGFGSTVVTNSPAQDVPLRIARFIGPFDRAADRSTEKRLKEVEAVIAAEGERTETIESEPAFADTLVWQRTISRYEMARSLAYEWYSCRSKLSEELRSEIAEGMAIAEDEYDLAKQEGRKLAWQLAPVFAAYDAILTFATPGEAPLGLTSTGDATFNRSWSLLGLPCISIPAGFGPLGLPVAVQLVGAPQGEERLLRAASRLEDILHRSGLRQKRVGRIA